MNSLIHNESLVNVVRGKKEETDLLKVRTFLNTNHFIFIKYVDKQIKLPPLLSFALYLIEIGSSQICAREGILSSYKPYDNDYNNLEK